jgi:hypothetical protein
MIENYAGIDPSAPDTIIDGPANGMLLETGMHEAFGEFKFCFIPTVR